MHNPYHWSNQIRIAEDYLKTGLFELIFTSYQIRKINLNYLQDQKFYRNLGINSWHEL